MAQWVKNPNAVAQITAEVGSISGPAQWVNGFGLAAAAA